MAKKIRRDSSDNSSDPSDEPLSFEQSLEELEEAVQQLEAGELDLAEALELFENGVRHLKNCYQRLDDAERRIERLTGVDADGNPVTQPFDDDSLTLEEKQEARSRRRTHDEEDARGRSTRRKGGGNSVDEGRELF